MTELPLDLSLVDVLFWVGGMFFGLISGLSRFKQNPYRNLSIFLQVSILLVKMAKSYLDSHPDTKEKINEEIKKKLDQIIQQLYEYQRDNKVGNDRPRALG